MPGISWIHGQRLFSTTVAFLFCFVFFAGCTQDGHGPNWDASNGDTGIDAADVGDARGDADARGGGSFALPEATPIPASAPDDSHCNAYGWCWLHPRPFPHAISHLQSTEDGVRALAYSGQIQGFQPVVWNGEEMSLLPKPVAPGQTLAGGTTTREGWLVIDRNGLVYDIGPQGSIRNTLQLQGSNFFGISGSSFHSFMAWSPRQSLVLVRGGQRETYTDPRSIQSVAVMWPNGDIWMISPGGEPSTRLEGDWEITPIGSNANLNEVVAIGASPAGPCVSVGKILGFRGPRLLHWTEEHQWDEIDYRGGRIQAIGCSQNDRLLVGDWEGQIHERQSPSGAEWTTETVTDQRILQTKRSGSDLYIASELGAHVYMDEGVNMVGAGFRVPRGRLKDDQISGIYTAMWANSAGSEIVLAHSSGFYRGTLDGWTQMEVGTELPLNVRRTFDTIWGIDDPRLAVAGTKLLRWNGDTWDEATDEVLGQEAGPPKAIVGDSDDDIWVLSSSQLAHFDGSQWSRVTEEDPSVADHFDAVTSEFADVAVADEGEVIVTAGNEIHRVYLEGNDWSAEKVGEAPCADVGETVARVHRASNQSIWVAGPQKCVAELSDGDWTDYGQPPSTQVSPAAGSRRFGVDFVTRPDNPRPFVTSAAGALRPRPDGILEPHFVGEMVGGMHVPAQDVILMLHSQGVIARYY